MRLLLDTHTFLWFINGSPQLSQTGRALIIDPSNESFISIASLWEIAIKVSLGKLQFDEPVERLIPQQIHANGFDMLDIAPSRIWGVAALPFRHRDPFDRMLVAQAIIEQIPIVSSDIAFDAYPVERLW
jgi:PIN domain nuclease of toxin-antitoxin system